MIKTDETLLKINLLKSKHIYNLLNYNFLYFFQRFYFTVLGVGFCCDFNAEFAGNISENLALKHVNYCRKATFHLNLPKGISTFLLRKSSE